MNRILGWVLLGAFACGPGPSLAQSQVITDSQLELGNRFVPATPQADEWVERSVWLPFSDKATTILVRKVGPRYFYQGDIIVDGEGLPVIAAGVEDQDDRWPNGTIPIAISPDVMANPDVLEALYDALNAVMINTEIKFVPRGGQKDYVEVVFGPGVAGAAAASRIGRSGGRQELVIHVLDVSAGTLMHELLHAAGLYHEQSRPDRDHFVDLDLRGMSDRQRANFDKVDAKMGGPYDYLSIMHYPEMAFSPNTPATPTIFCKTNGVRVACPQQMGQQGGLSTGDIAGLDAIYSEISRFSEEGWDASITRAVRALPPVPFTGSFEWARTVGTPKLPNFGNGAVDYLNLQLLAPREMTISWSRGVKSVSYSNWRDPIPVSYRPLSISATRSLLGFDASVPPSLPLIVKAEVFARRWNAPPKPAACVMRVKRCGAYWLGFDSASTGTVSNPATAAPYQLSITGAWNVGSLPTVFEQGTRTLTIDPVQRVADKPLWSMRPVEGVYRIEASPH